MKPGSRIWIASVVDDRAWVHEAVVEHVAETGEVAYRLCPSGGMLHMSHHLMGILLNRADAFAWCAKKLRQRAKQLMQAADECEVAA